MSKVTLTRLGSMVNAVTAINGVITEIESAFDNTISRDGSAPNTMSGNLDANGNRILNLAAPVYDHEPARMSDVETVLAAATGGSIPAGTFPTTILSTDPLNASNLTSGTIPDARMPNLTGDITSTEGTVATTLSNNTVSTAKIVDLAVTTAKINNLAVTNGKLAADSVDETKIQDNSIGADQLQSNAVTTAKIMDANVTPAKLSQKVTSGTAIATTSGTSHDFTNIPSWATMIVVSLAGVSLSGTALIRIQLGDLGGVETSGYLTMGAIMGTVAAQTAGFDLYTNVPNAARVMSGSIMFTLLDPATNTWVGSGTFNDDVTAWIIHVSGQKSISATLDRVRITTSNGTDTFDAGKVNIIYQ
jgi:hypothetical protein